MAVKKITRKNFKPFGWVIEYPRREKYPRGKNLFRFVRREKASVGWRIAYLVVRDKAVRKLEQHVESLESLEPVKGKSLLYVAKERLPAAIECFYLDRPVILKKNIWHGIVTLGGEADIKITENAKVKCVYWRLGFWLPNQKEIRGHR